MNGDLISRQAAIDTLGVGAELLRRLLDDLDVVGVELEKYEWGLGVIESYISDMKELPAAEPRKGKWKRMTFVTPKGYRDTWCCDQCGDSVGTIRRNYCPNCGADMREESNG